MMVAIECSDLQKVFLSQSGCVSDRVRSFLTLGKSRYRVLPRAYPYLNQTLINDKHTHVFSGGSMTKWTKILFKCLTD